MSRPLRTHSWAANTRSTQHTRTRLKALHDKGLITNDGFDSKRQEILDQL